MAASVYFSHKELQGVNGEKKREMLREIGHPFEDLPMRFRRGEYVQRVRVERMLTVEELAFIPEKHRPIGPIERNEVQVVELPEIRNRGDKPLQVLFPSLFPKNK
jgi:tRNA(His) 5'-end guanylyltransferase